jgi:hypothetical protein
MQEGILLVIVMRWYDITYVKEDVWVILKGHEDPMLCHIRYSHISSTIGLVWVLRVVLSMY